MQSADLRGADLTDADLRGSRLYSAQLDQASLRNADLRGANLAETSGKEADLSGANLSVPWIRRQTSIVDSLFRFMVSAAIGVVIVAAIYSEDLLVVSMSICLGGWVVHSTAAFRDWFGDIKNHRTAESVGGNYSSASLIKANMTGTVMKNWIMDGANLTGARVRLANMENARLSNADVSGCNFRKTRLYNTKFGGARFSRRTRWPRVPLMRRLGQFTKSPSWLGFGRVIIGYPNVPPVGDDGRVLPGTKFRWDGTWEQLYLQA
jgi:hypothetical protein